MSATTIGTITDRQHSYLLTLLDDRDLFKSPKFFDSVNAMDHGEFAEYMVSLRAQVATLSKSEASKWIGALVALPKKQQETVASVGSPGPWKVQQHKYEGDAKYGDETFYWMQRVGGKGVPRGSYAIERSALRYPAAFSNEVLFFSVWISDDGERWTVRMYASDERVKISRSLQYDVLEAIALDPSAAAARYGHEIGKCGICSRKLTNDASRERGIGPICAEKWGW